MKDFYLEHETKDKTKRERVLEVIKPICDVFGITDYDYICNEEKERLVVEGQEIGTRGNSIGATVDELINYIWCNTFAENRCLGAFEKQTMRVIKRYWE
ncbi:MAG: hypothetical protein ACI4R8_01210 [Candidatus Caccovivens sp.]